MKSLFPILEQGLENTEMGEKELWEAVHQQERVVMLACDTSGARETTSCFRRAKEGLEMIGIQKMTIEVAHDLAYQTHQGDNLIKEMKALFEKA